jgi:hypothetical protein
MILCGYVQYDLMPVQLDLVGIHAEFDSDVFPDFHIAENVQWGYIRQGHLRQGMNLQIGLVVAWLLIGFAMVSISFFSFGSFWRFRRNRQR